MDTSRDTPPTIPSVGTDPKEKTIEIHSGREGLDALKVSTATVEGINLTEILATPEGRETFKIKKIVLAGPPRSGKSCTRQGLKNIIRSISGAPYPYFITACPDGEGAWFQEAMNADAELAAKLKAEYKSRFTPEFVTRIAESVKNLKPEHNPLNFIDIGGIISPENEQICADANGAILICGKTAVEQGLPAKWKDFFTGLGIPIIAEVYSDYTGTEDIVDTVGEDAVFRGSVHHLERGENLTKRETLQALAQHVVVLGKEPSHEKLSLKSLEQKLTKYGIDVSKFGKGEAKTIGHLLGEVESGESELIERNGELVRCLRVLNINVFADIQGMRHRLVESRQDFSDGRTRERKLSASISEKLHKDEGSEDSIGRALEEEIGVKNFKIISPTQETVETVDSPSFPNLSSEYSIQTVDVLLDPSEYKDRYQEVQKDKTTYFVWE